MSAPSSPSANASGFGILILRTTPVCLSPCQIRSRPTSTDTDRLLDIGWPRDPCSAACITNMALWRSLLSDGFYFSDYNHLSFSQIPICLIH